MSDLIERAKVNEIIDKLSGDDPLQASPSVWYGLHMIKNLPSAQRWIPVTERLPEPNEEDKAGFIKAYLVQDGWWMDVARWDGEYWVAWGYGTVLKNVIAWMPLPKPYRKETEDAEIH